ncbi:hypothetical protein ACS0TY_001972 [Phlomoides rotata]
MEFDTAHFITDVSGKYPRLWALKGAHPVIVNRWYKFGALALIRTVAPSFREISELPDWVPSKKIRHVLRQATNHQLARMINGGNLLSSHIKGRLKAQKKISKVEKINTSFSFFFSTSRVFTYYGSFNCGVGLG